MALRDTLVGRIIVCIKVFRPDELLDLTAKNKLGDPPIGWDATFLQTEFLGFLNADATGFTDILHRLLAKSDVAETTKLGDLADTITEKSSTDDFELTTRAYEAKSRERVRLSLRQNVAMIAQIGEDAIDPAKQLSVYIPDPAGRQDLRARLTTDLKKYLLSRIALGDLDGSLLRVREYVLYHMLA